MHGGGKASASDHSTTDRKMAGRSCGAGGGVVVLNKARHVSRFE